MASLRGGTTKILALVPGRLGLYSDQVMGLRVTEIWLYWGNIGVMLGLYWGYIEVILALYEL